jgi:hypothetical protein
MKHCLFNLAAGLSLLLALMVVGLWGRSYWHIDTLMWEKGWFDHSIHSFSGSLEYAMREGLRRGSFDWHYSHLALKQAMRIQLIVPAATWYGRLGFSYSHRIWTNLPGGPVHDIDLAVPDWSLMLLLSVLPLWRGWAWHEARRGGQRGFSVGPAGPAG